MEVVQVRMPKGMIKMIDSFVKKEIYTSRSDAVRDAVRLIEWKRMIGSIPNTGDSVEEVREIRRKLSKEDLDLEHINSL